MALHPNSEKLVDDFFAAIAPIEAAYRHIGFSYLAVKFGGRFVIVRGRVFLSVSLLTFRPQHFQSRNVRAVHYAAKELGHNPRPSYAALHFFRDPEVQHHAPLAQQALINGVKRDEQRKPPER